MAEDRTPDFNPNQKPEHTPRHMDDFHRLKKLEPRLRRLTQSVREDKARLRQDLEWGFITLSTELEDESSSYSKRVLVQTSDDEIAELPGRTHRVVDGVHTVELPITALEELASRPEIKFVESGRRMSVSLDTSVPAAKVDIVHEPGPERPDLHGTDVVVGIVDMGFDFTLDDFIGPNGSTRIAYLWDQSLRARRGERAPQEFGYGVEYTSEVIDEALLSQEPFARVRHQPPVAAHGTHVMGIAAGNGSSRDATYPREEYVGVADRATLILVQPHLPVRRTDDAPEPELGTFFTDSAYVVDAIHYIFQRAHDLRKPCVINISLGQNSGSHDGESIVERAIDRLLEQPGRAVVVAAGNEHIWRTHASGTLTTGETRTLHWRVGEPPTGFPPAPEDVEDRTPNEMEIWYSSRDKLRVRVIDPDRRMTQYVAPDDAGMFPLGSATVYIDSERFTMLNGDARIYIEICPRPGSAVRPGIWQVELTAGVGHGDRFDAWIERDVRDPSKGFVDQSSFGNGDFDPSKTLGTPATARRAIAVANYDHRLVSPCLSSGRGPTRDGRKKPEVSAPGTAVLSSGALGGRPGEGGRALPVRIAMTGTSMAAPHVTGVVALLFEEAARFSPTLLSAEQMRGVVIASASPPPGVAVFDDAWGFGRLDAQAAVGVVRKTPQYT